MNPFRALRDRRARNRRRREEHDRWEEMWGRPDFAPPWLGRGVAGEVVEAVESGWFRPERAALDIGCGEGDIAAWLARRGFPSVGVDIAPAAVARARERFGEEPGRLEFLALDLCAQAPPDRRYGILVDRGCFHQLADEDVPSFLDVLLSVSASDARLLLFIKAFRGRQSLDDPLERERRTRRVQEAFGRAFAIERIDPTFLDPGNGEDPDRALPGLVYWMSRT